MSMYFVSRRVLDTNSIALGVTMFIEGDMIHMGLGLDPRPYTCALLADV